MSGGSRPPPRRHSGGLRRRVLLSGIAALYALSIPWYRESGAEPRLWLGLPDWVAVAVLCYAGVAILNAWAWLAGGIEDRAPDDGAP